MQGLPEELGLALLFGVIWLVQLLYKHLRRKAASTEPPVTEQAPPRRAAEPPAPQVATATLPPLPALQTAAPARATPQAPGPTRRRFSRAALMPDRRAAQQAVVIATILQPCHANRRAEVDSPPG